MKKKKLNYVGKAENKNTLRETEYIASTDLCLSTFRVSKYGT